MYKRLAVFFLFSRKTEAGKESLQFELAKRERICFPTEIVKRIKKPSIRNDIDAALRLTLGDRCGIA